MKRRQRLALLIGGLAMGTVLFAACGFPEVAFAPEDAGGDGNRDVSDTSRPDVAIAKDATSDAPSEAEPEDAGPVLDANPDVAVAENAGGKVDAAGCNVCDCDLDGYNRDAAGCGVGPFDCDDKDTRAHPNQIFLDQDAEPPMNGNWNCDSMIEKGYPENVNCEGLLLGVNCTKVLGFVGTVACGHTGKFVKCKQVPVLGLPLACGVDSDSVDNGKVQVCK